MPTEKNGLWIPKESSEKLTRGFLTLSTIFLEQGLYEQASAYLKKAEQTILHTAGPPPDDGIFDGPGFFT